MLRLKEPAVFMLSLAFVLVNLVLMARELYWFSLLPVALILLWAMFTAVDRLLYFVAFTTPLSINLEQLEIGGIGVALPTEPLLVGLMLLFLIKMSIEPGLLDKRLLRHPITVFILLHLAWMIVCILPSSMPLVSFKFTLARAWFVSVMFFLVSVVFRTREQMERAILSYMAGLFVVVMYTLIHHAQFDFAQDPAHWVMSPFFKDHTSYGAVLAFFLPFGLAYTFAPERRKLERIFLFMVFLVLALGLLFSYTRAAWLSLVGAMALYVVIRMHIPVWSLMTLALLLGGLYWYNSEQIHIALERNREESSDDLGEHVRSISNISSDASNLERINRWNSALRMFSERPLFGWGPGTYMFQYAPFQASEDRTIISTNFGEGGNAHSEYLGPLSEQGVLGLVFVLALVILPLVVGIQLLHRMSAGPDRRLVLSVLLGIMTYYLHGALNNFLDTDKASVPFWMFLFILVHFDLKYPGTAALVDGPASESVR